MGGNARSVTIHTSVRDGVAVAVVGGDLDDTAVLVLDEVRTQLQSRPPTLIPDLRAVTFLGSGGLSTLVESHYQATGTGTRLLIVADQRAVLRPLKVTGLDELVDLQPDLETALETAH